MKKIIFAIVGDSGSGKTTLGLFVEKNNPEFSFVPSYTRRPKRMDDVPGTHTFIGDDVKTPAEKDLLAYGIFGGYEYFATHQQILCDDTIKLYTIDEKSLLDMIKKWGDFYNIKKIYIRRDDRGNIPNDRKSRDADRNRLPDSFYDLIIDNNFDNINDFLSYGQKEIETLKEKIYASNE